VTDLRRGFTGLSGMVQTALQENPFSGHVFVFRGRWRDLIKMLWSVSFCEATRARKIYLAASHERNRGANSRTVVHVALKGSIGGVRCAATIRRWPCEKRIYRELICKNFVHGILRA